MSLTLAAFMWATRVIDPKDLNGNADKPVIEKCENVEDTNEPLVGALKPPVK